MIDRTTFKLSIIIPCYNEKNTRTVSILAGQNEPGYAIIESLFDYVSLAERYRPKVPAPE